jgi:small subunit ribosomal protein S10
MQLKSNSYQYAKQIKINFKFKSFHKHSFKFVLPKILRKVNGMSINTTGFASLPIKTERFTVLRSPHVDKKSREQFEIKFYSKILSTSFNFEDSFEKQKAKLLINYIKNSSSGLNLKITYTTF